MALVGNFLWLLLGGWFAAMVWGIAGILFIWTPYGIALLRFARLNLAPFGKDILTVKEIESAKKHLSEPLPDQGAPMNAKWGSGAVNSIMLLFKILWIPFGILLFLVHILQGIALMITIVGIPFGMQAFKIASASLMPMGKRVVTKDFALEVRRINAQSALA